MLRKKIVSRQTEETASAVSFLLTGAVQRCNRFVIDRPVKDAYNLCIAHNTENARKGGRERKSVEMKKFFALIMALVLALSLVACGEKNDNKKLMGTWTYTVDMTEMMNQEMAASLELEELTVGADFGMDLVLTVADDGAYSLAVDTAATGDSLNAYLQALTPALIESMYASAEQQGVSREEFDAGLAESGMSAEELVSAILGAFDLGTLLESMLGDEAGAIDSGYCTAKDGKLYMAATAEELANADYVTYTFNSDGTMSWTDEDGQVSSQLAPEEQELFQFPMVWTKQAA